MFCIFGRLKLSCLWKTLINDAALLKGLPDQNCRWHNLMMSLHALKKKNHIFSWNVHHISKWFSRNFNLLSCDSISHNLQKSCSKERKYFWTKTKKLHSNKFLPQMLTWLILLHKKNSTNLLHKCKVITFSGIWSSEIYLHLFSFMIKNKPLIIYISVAFYSELLLHVSGRWRIIWNQLKA